MSVQNYKIRLKRHIVIIAVMFACALIAPAAKAVDIIVNPSTPVNAISRGTARAIFGMRLLKWPDGQPIRVFVLEDASPTHIAFCKEVLNIYPYQLRQSWDRLVYSGTGQAPIEVASEEEMLARVASQPGAIGYLKRSMLNDRVRLLLLQ